MLYRTQLFFQKSYFFKGRLIFVIFSGEDCDKNKYLYTQISVIIKESGLKHVCDFISGPMLYGSTFFLGILLGILCDAHTLLDPTVLKLLVLGILALLISGIGGILGGYIMYFIKRGDFNPVIGIAAVSCVPTTAKVAQKIVSHDNPSSFILADALGANITGVITSAIIAAIYVTVFPML